MLTMSFKKQAVWSSLIHTKLHHLPSETKKTSHIKKTSQENHLTQTLNMILTGCLTFPCNDPVKLQVHTLTKTTSRHRESPFLPSYGGWAYGCMITEGENEHYGPSIIWEDYPIRI